MYRIDRQVVVVVLCTCLLQLGWGLTTSTNQAQTQPRKKQTKAKSGSPKAKTSKATDWPQFRGPGGLGRSDAKGPPVTWSATQNIAWKTELPGAGASCPIIVGERVFVTCYSGYAVPGQPRGELEELKRHLICLSRSDGREVWAKRFDAALPEQASVREHGYASSTPAADGDRLYVFFGKSGVFALDHSGRQLWHADVGSKVHGWGSATSPVLYKDLVIVNASVESDSLVALDKRTGKEVWRTDGMRESWNTPLLVDVPGGKTELVVAILRKILGLDPATGEQLWSCATDIDWYMVPSLVAHDGVVYCIGGRSGGALAVRAGGRGDVAATHRLWTGRKGSNVSSPILHEGHLYWMHENLAIAYCADAKTGEIVYEARVAGAGQVYASPVLADGRLYYVGRRGGVFVVAARPEFELLAHNTLNDTSTFDASPAVAGDRLLLRSDRCLYCLGLK